MELNYNHQFDQNIPQGVIERAGENTIFIVYKLKYNNKTLDKVKDLCANFSAMIRSMKNRFPDMDFGCIMGFGEKAWTKLFPDQDKPIELETFK